MTVRIICDTACDLPEELAQSYGISLVPLHVRFGSKEFVDREELSTKEFWRLCSSGGALPETAAPAPGAFHTAFESAAASGASAALCVTISSRLSATFDSASRAAKEMRPRFLVEVFDSRSATMGEGLVAVAAAEAAREGKDLAGVLSAAESTRRRLAVFGAIDTLENLRRGGRIGGAAAALGALLSIKPVIEVRDGVVEGESKQRTRAKSLRYLAGKLRAAGPVERLAIMGAEAADFDEFVTLIADIVSLEPKILADIGPVIGTHAGPGAIGVAWVAASPEP
ncbi:MAG: DegV family protein [Actinomycetota bacterium]|nr:DegV family protein [Actinomycetota bacterium]